MAAKVCNIELGDYISKVCISEQRGKRYQISKSFLFETPEGCVQDGQIVDFINLSQVIKRHLSENRQSGVKNVNFTLTSSRVVSREVVLPPVKENRIKMTVESNVSEYFPVDVSSYNVASCVLEQLSGENEGWRVQVVAAPRLLIEGYMALAEALGMHLENIDYCGNSQYQVLRPVPTEGVVLYVDVNDNNTFVSFMQNGTLLLQRNIAAGGGDLIRELLSADNGRSYIEVLWDAADMGYINKFIDDETYGFSMNRVVAGIARSEDYFISRYPHLRVDKVVLMGVCSRIAGLRDSVSSALSDTETVLLSEVEGIRVMANSSDGISSYINCIGALVAPLELYSEALRDGGGAVKRTSDSLVGSILLCIFCIGLGLGLSGYAALSYYDKLSEEEQLKQRREELLYVEDIYNTYLSYEATRDNLETVRACSDTPTSELRAFFEEIERKMPSGMIILSASASDAGISMNMTTTGLEEADVVISQLRSFESISTITVSTVIETTDENGYTYATFSVSCGFNPVAVQ